MSYEVWITVKSPFLANYAASASCNNSTLFLNAWWLFVSRFQYFKKEIRIISLKVWQPFWFVWHVSSLSTPSRHELTSILGKVDKSWDRKTTSCIIPFLFYLFFTSLEDLFWLSWSLFFSELTKSVSTLFFKNTFSRLDDQKVFFLLSFPAFTA